MFTQGGCALSHMLRVEAASRPLHLLQCPLQSTCHLASLLAWVNTLLPDSLASEWALGITTGLSSSLCDGQVGCTPPVPAPTLSPPSSPSLSVQRRVPGSLGPLEPEVTMPRVREGGNWLRPGRSLDSWGEPSSFGGSVFCPALDPEKQDPSFLLVGRTFL